MDLRTEIENIVHEILMEGVTKEDAVKELLNLHIVSESYIKCWNCKQFEQTGTNYAGNEVGHCKLNDCKVSHPKWQKCGEYEQCGNFR
jgi:hypothetical protein